MILSLTLAFTLAAAENVPKRPPGSKTWTRPMACEALVMKGLDARKPLDEIFAKAKAQERTIEKTARNYIHGPEQKYFLGVARAVTAALGKHHQTFLREQDLRKMDIPHHMAILRAIAAFDFKRPRWSMVQIDEAIKLRHSLKEYTECKESPPDPDDLFEADEPS